MRDEAAPDEAALGALTPRRAGLVAVVAVGSALVLRPDVAPATVEEQRARLPPPAQCVDPVEGVWMSHKYEAIQGLWYVFTLRIHRAADNTLTGDIASHAWSGTPAEPEPPACRPGLLHWIVRMTAAGRVAGSRIDFHGLRWAVEREFCGAGTGPADYNLDHFTGVIDPAIQEFQSVNNDGGDLVDDPTVFRRVRCLEPASPPHPYVAPPAFQPPTRRGCAARLGW